jgi:hypothetical protein
MKKSTLGLAALVSLLLGFVVASCTGCATTGPNADFAQKAITAAGLAPDFRGDVTLHEKVNAPGGPGLTLTITDLRQENGRWVWGGLVETRDGVWTSGGLTITPRPKP